MQGMSRPPEPGEQVPSYKGLPPEVREPYEERLEESRYEQPGIVPRAYRRRQIVLVLGIFILAAIVAIVAMQLN